MSAWLTDISAFSCIFASELGAVVLGVDYRLALEHPFPAPLDDCCEALEWVCTLLFQRHVKSMLMAINQVTKHAAEYNTHPTRI